MMTKQSQTHSLTITKHKARFAILILAVAMAVATPSHAWATGGQLTGKVSNSDGIGQAETLVQVVAPADGAVVASTYTDVSGNYLVAASIGTYEIRFVPPPSSPYRESTVSNITIAAATVLNVVLVPLGLIQVSGVVRGAGGSPVSNVGVVVGGLAGDNTDGDGRYSVTVPPGHYSLRLHGSNGVGGVDWFQLDTPSIDATQDRVQDLTLPAVVHLTVIVQDADGNPIQGAAVQAGNQSMNGFELYPGGQASGHGALSGSGSTDAAGRRTLNAFPGALSCCNSVTLPNGLSIPFTAPPFTTDMTILVQLQPPDTDSPEITVPADLAVTAQTAAGAVVTYIVTAFDASDGSLTPSCSPPSGALFSIGTTLVTCQATDQAGNTSTASFTVTVTISTDQTLPTVSVDNPLAGASYSVNQFAIASFACNDEPDGSGVDSCMATVDGSAIVNGAPLPTSTAGTHTVTVTAVDHAGNAATLSRSYTVWSEWPGPVDAPPMVNSAKAGAGIPLVFSLNGNYGLGIFEPGYPKSQNVSCLTLEDNPTDPIESTTSTPAGLTYNQANDQYTYVWKSDKAWAGTCRQVVLAFATSVPGYAGAQAVFVFEFR
jgi:hypothetical protein